MSGESEGSEVSNKETTELLRVASIDHREVKGVGPKSLDRMTKYENQLLEGGSMGGLPHFLSQTDLSLRQLSEELGVSRNTIAAVYDHFGIPRHTQKEASGLVLKKLWQDPNYAEKKTEEARQRYHAFRSNPDIERRRIEGVKRWARSPENKKRVSEAATRMWQDPEMRDHITRANRESALAQWQDPEMREKMVRAIREACANSPLKVETKRKISEAVRARQADPEYQLIEIERRRKISQSQELMWQDPEFRERQLKILEAARSDSEVEARRIEALRARMKDPEVRARQGELARKASTDPESRKKRSESMRKKWEDPEWREKQLSILQEVIDDEEFQQRRRAGLQAKWEDPEWREKMTELSRTRMTQMSHDPDHQKKAAEGIRGLRSDPNSANRFYLPTIQGYRRDIDYHAQSAWEANFARILMFTKREFSPKESVVLEVDKDFSDLFVYEITQYTLDFLVVDPRGNLVAYDLVAHPLEDPVGLAKAEMFMRQYPEIKLHIVDEKMYNRLRNNFRKPINESPDFCGWEDSSDNLRNNPSKYE